MKNPVGAFLVAGAVVATSLLSGAAGPTLAITTPMAAPRWAALERQLLADNVAPAREFFKKYFDDRGYLQCFVRWGADDGADDAFENFNGWPELHALGASDEIMQMYLKGHEGLIKQYTEAKTTEVPAGRGGIYYKEFDAQQDWMHHGEGLQLFNRMGLSIPNDAKYKERARRFAGFYMAEDPEAPNYDPQHKLIRSLMNGSRGPLLRQATSIDWVGDPFDPTGFVTLHAERNFKEMLAHYEEYHDVVGDSFLNLPATVLPMDAYLVTGDDKYKRWIVEYMERPQAYLHGNPLAIIGRVVKGQLTALIFGTQIVPDVVRTPRLLRYPTVDALLAVTLVSYGLVALLVMDLWWTRRLLLARWRIPLVGCSWHVTSHRRRSPTRRSGHSSSSSRTGTRTGRGCCGARTRRSNKSGTGSRATFTTGRSRACPPHRSRSKRLC